jgi:hypothetical protein
MRCTSLRYVAAHPYMSSDFFIAMYAGIEIAKKLAPLLHKFKLTDRILCTVKDQGANLGARLIYIILLPCCPDNFAKA